MKLNMHILYYNILCNSGNQYTGIEFVHEDTLYPCMVKRSTVITVYVVNVHSLTCILFLYKDHLYIKTPCLQ